MSREVRVPDMGDVAEAEVIEVFVQSGQRIGADEPLITLESDKAAMDLPSPFAGTVEQLHVSVGDLVSAESLIATLSDQSGEEASTLADPPPPEPTPASPSKLPAVDPVASSEEASSTPVARLGTLPHAGPAVRRFARELGVDLSQVAGHGRRGRILREDVSQYVKAVMTRQQQGTAQVRPSSPPVDAGRFGPTHTEPLSRIRKRSGANLQRNWQLAPHVTQHHEADITELERLRKEYVDRPEFARLTLTACILQACAQTLQELPRVNASLSEDGRELIYRDYVHIGLAVNTDEGLVVPVIREVDQKSIAVIAQEMEELTERARAQQLSAEDMQGGGFTLSNLGGIGGAHFSPVINLPQAAVLGVARACQRPRCLQDAIVPRLILPLSLSYDHRVIDGVEGAQFVVGLSARLERPEQLCWEEETPS